MADRRARRTQKVLKETLIAMVLENGFHTVSVSQLVERADVNRGTFYLHYRDIHDLLDRIKADMFQELHAIISSFEAEELQQTIYPYLSAIFRYLSDNRDLCLMLLGENGDAAFVEQLKRMVETKCFQSLKESYQPNNGSDCEYFCAYAVSGCIGILQRWLENGMLQTPEELTAIIERIIQQGVAFLKSGNDLEL